MKPRAVEPGAIVAAVRGRGGVLAALLAITALAAWLRLVDLDRAGIGNTFYAAAVRSMGASWHNFLYAAFDPAGTLTVDKPPLALWIQVAFSKALGFEGRSLILPMALAGTAAVPLTFGAARRSHGVAAALVAAALLAVLPESVATARDSTMDALMMALLAASAWLLVAAVEGRSSRLLLAWAVLMGLVFNVKFFEGFVVMPAAALYIALRWRGEWRARAPAVAAAAAVLTAVALSWATFVELTPASQRPLVMNDASNSEFGLIARYNGIERVLPGEVTIFAPGENADDETRAAVASIARQFGVGDAGPLRLFTDANGPLLGVHAALALLGVAAVAWRRRDWLDGPGALWTGWALTGIVLFSFSNRAAAHYTESYAPALAVLGAVGVVEGWRARRAWRGAVLPLAALAVLAFAWNASRDFPPIAGATSAVALGGALAAAAALVALLPRGPAALPNALRDALHNTLRDALRGTAAAAVIAVPLAPSLWIALDAPSGEQITRPNPLIYAREGAGQPAGRSVPAEEVVRRAEASNPDARYAFAIDGINSAGEAIAYTGAAVLPIWSEYQRRPVLESGRLFSLLRDGEVPYVLMRRRLSTSSLLGGPLSAVALFCRLDRSARVGEAWLLWRCDGR